MKKGEYKARGLDVKNKIRKLTTYLKKHPNNLVAKKRLEFLTNTNKP